MNDLDSGFWFIFPADPSIKDPNQLHLQLSSLSLQPSPAPQPLTLTKKGPEIAESPAAGAETPEPRLGAWQRSQNNQGFHSRASPLRLSRPGCWGEGRRGKRGTDKALTAPSDIPLNANTGRKSCYGATDTKKQQQKKANSSHCVWRTKREISTPTAPGAAPAGKP